MDAPLPDQAGALVEQILEGAAGDVDALLAALEPELRGQVEEALVALRRLDGAFAPGGPGGDLQAGQELGEYRLVRLLGRGGMGTVWEAEQATLRRRVALKILDSGQVAQPQQLARFRREAEAGARLRHPHIVTVHAVGEEQGRHYIAQELVEGGRTLADELAELRQAGRLPAGYYRRAAERLADVARALAYAHEAGVVHRDVKPSNILVERDGRLRIGDFGLAMLVGDPALSRSGDIAGTPFYMSPEQVAGRRGAQGPSADVFSLGATMYEVLTLQRPFEGDSILEVLGKIRETEPRDPREIRERVPADLAVICLHALEKKPERRYPAISAFAEDLRRFLADQPITARPPGVLERAQRWARRHPVATVGGSIAAVAFAAVSFLLVQNALARKDAEAEASTAQNVTDFLEDLFRGVSPFETRGSRTLKEILDDGIRQIDQLDDEPRVQARLLGILAYAALDTADFARADELAQRCLLVAGTLGEEGDPARLRALSVLGQSQVHQGHLEEGVRFLREYYERTAAIAEAASPAVRSAATYLAAALMQLERSDEAEPLLRAALSPGGPELPQIGVRVTAQYWLGWIEFDRSHYVAAESLFRGALAGYQQLDGPDHVQVGGVLLALASVRSEQGDGAEAQSLCERAHAIYERELGPDDHRTIGALMELGNAFAVQGNHEQAAAAHRGAYDALSAKLSPTHPFALNAASNLVADYIKLERPADAAPLLDSLLEHGAEVFGADSMSYRMLRLKKGIVLGETGQLEEALRWLEELLADVERIEGPDHSLTVDTLCRLALYREETQDYAGAAELRERVLEIVRRRPGALHISTSDALRSLAHVRRLQGREEEAAALEAEAGSSP